jgi:hypothetical protein
MKNIKSFEIFEESKFYVDEKSNSSRYSYVGIMPKSVNGRPLATSHDFRPLFYVDKNEVEMALRVLRDNLENLFPTTHDNYNVTSTGESGMEDIIHRRHSVVRGRRNPNSNYGLPDFYEWIRENGIVL